MRVNQTGLLIGLLPLLLLSPLLAIASGSASLELNTVVQALLNLLSGHEPQNVGERIVIELRTPRVLMAMICGAGLALSGLVLQSVTRNPLADPYLFGISSGASLGAVVAITVGFGALALPFTAFAGALVAVAVVMIMARDGQVERLILAGVAVSFLLGSLSNLLLYFSDPRAVQAVLFWTLGSFARADWSALTAPALMLLLTLVVICQQQRPLLALMAGDESAHTQGVAVQSLRLAMLLLTAMMTAILVANCGGIGFVGLMVPHIVRMLVGSGGVRHVLITAMVGALLMVWVDLLARRLLPNQELPVGVITALLGSLFFLLFLLKRRGNL
ncbi:FecCD family ABC transporter permease [Ferrimonas senticii]|uniref:FecCD family ABC transporter permease n=1 Tax=Ferrimonas senticii TaxID=394566 RepID=UPI0003F6D00B|nr:iron ABC transporter permease [Ferrimonas senticii]